jgi:hypothetical protein
LASVAAIALVVAVLTGKDSGVSCSLTGAAAAAIVAGVTHGKDTTEIFAPAATGVAVPAACKPTVDALIKKPDQKVKFNIQLPNGEQSTANLAGSQLPRGTPSQALSCLNWVFQAGRTLCEEGRLPPVAPLPRGR